MILEKLASIEELYNLYNNYNRLYFKNRLPKESHIKIEWSNRLSRSAGVCYRTSKIIRLSTAYHKKHPKEIGGTLLHEMIHIEVRGHGEEFKGELKRIQDLGGKVSRYSMEPAKEPRWEYVCISCGQTIRKYKRYPQNIICGICKSKFKEKYIEHVEIT